MMSAEIQPHFKIADMLQHLEEKPEVIAARLWRVREIMDLTKREFAEKAGMSQQVYGPFEKGKRDISLQAAKKLQKTYFSSCYAHIA